MAKRSVLKLALFVLSGPLIVISLIAELFNLWNLRDDVQYCLRVIDSKSETIPENFVRALVAAEDRRSELHPGVDPIAIIRAVYVRSTYKRVQGASTIEQQLV